MRKAPMRPSSITPGPIKTQQAFSQKGGSVKGDNDSDYDFEPLELMTEREELADILEQVHSK